MIWFLVGLVLGAIVVVSVEAAALFYFVNRLARKSKYKSSSSPSLQDLDSQQSLDFSYNKQFNFLCLRVLFGFWKRKNFLRTSFPKTKRGKKDIWEVYPVRKYAKIKDSVLLLKESDGSQKAIPLKGCLIEAVSASTLPSRKWAKRFPIKVESQNSMIYNVSKTIYIYLETSWEKESWCKALRLASCNKKETLDWFTMVNEEFHGYLTSLKGYSSFMKPSMGLIAESPSLGLSGESIDRSNRLDGSSSKVRLLWKKLAKKASKPGVESKALCSLYPGREERKSEKFHPCQESLFCASSVKSGTKAPNNSGDENVESLSRMFPRSASQSQSSVLSDTDSDDKFVIDEATVCWNLLIFRLFFDVKNNVGLKRSIQARIQRTLSNMRTPSYIGEIICTGIDAGNLPPYVHAMRVLPMDINEVWAFEVDIEYSGGVVLDVETRLEVRELDIQKGIVDANSESSSVGDVSSDLLEGFEFYGKQLNIPEGTIDGQVQKDGGDPKLDGLNNNKSTVLGSTYVSRWKSILNSIAKQVSQVPLSLSIRVKSLRGTLRLHIKPPPSDQLWFSFTSMPDLEFELESYVGDHKITNGHIAFFLINRFKASIRETMVLPNAESICIPWMVAEKNDWVPRYVAPFIWLGQEASGDHTVASEGSSSQIGEAKTKRQGSRETAIDYPESNLQNPKNVDNIQQPNAVPRVVSTPSTSSSIPSLQNSKSLQQLRTPLLVDEPQETCQECKEETLECQASSRSPMQLEKQSIGNEEDDSKPKKTGRKARMLDLGKKMGEKLEEKRRHIEEKSRHIVEKMRGP